MSEEFAPTPPAQTIPLEEFVAEIESDPEMKAVLDEARKMDMLEGATATDITPAQDDEPKELTPDSLEFHLMARGMPINARSRPDSSGLRKAAEEAVEALEPYDDIKPRDWATDREKLRAAYANLRAALEGK